MKKYLLLLYLRIVLWGMFSCNDIAVEDTLLRAGQLMNAYPDSALALLIQDVTKESSLPESQRAHWALLVTQAQDKSFVSHTSDSLICEAASYYEAHGSLQQQMLAWYYAGRVSQDLGKAPQAQDAYLKALKAGESSTDMGLLARIHSNLGMLYTYQEAYNAALPCLKQAVTYFYQAGDTLYRALALRDVARVYTMLKQTDSAAIYYQQAAPHTDSFDYPFVMNELGLIYCERGEIDTAYKYVQEALAHIRADGDFTPVYLIAGRVYREKGKTDSARYYLLKSMDSPQLETRTAACYYLYNMARDQRQWEEYARLQKQHEALRDSVIAQIYTETLLRMQSLYNYQQIENEANRYKLSNAENQKKLLILFLLFIALSCTLGGFVTFIRYRKTKQERKLKSLFQRLVRNKFHISGEQIQVNNIRIDELGKLMQTKPDNTLKWEHSILLYMNQGILNTLHERTESDSLLKEEAIYKKIHDSSTTKLATKDWGVLTETIDRLYPCFKLHLCEERKLSEENIQTAYLIKCGLKQNDITRVTRNNPNTISMRLKSLAGKILGEKEMKRDWNKQLFSYIIDLY